jgi:hypothetical protein
MTETTGTDDGNMSFDRWVFEYGARLHGTILENAFDEGFAVTHIGGGALALRKDADDDEVFWLITDSTSLRDDLDPEAVDWIVGKYRMHEDSSTSAIIVDEKTSLAGALDMHGLLTAVSGDPSYVCYPTWEAAKAELSSDSFGDNT